MRSHLREARFLENAIAPIIFSDGRDTIALKKFLEDAIALSYTTLAKIVRTKCQEIKMQVKDMTVEQLTDLIRHIVEQCLEEYFGDPDEGKEIKEEVKQLLMKFRKGKETY